MRQLIKTSAVTIGLVCVYFASPAFAAKTETYNQLNLFADVFERIRSQYVKDVDDEIGTRLSKFMKLFCHYNFGIIEIAHMLSMSERRASNNVHEGLSSLAIYYGYKKVHNTIRGQGTKNQRQRVPKVGSI